MRSYPRKDSQDRDSLNPRSTEYSKSGSDDAAAASNTAFDPEKTAPETEDKSVGEESGKSQKGVSVLWYSFCRRIKRHSERSHLRIG